MQNPPPPPPEGPPPYSAPGTGIDKRTGATLSYVLWWVTGIIFLFVGKDDPDVKYHAAQSIVLLGPIFLVAYLFGYVGGVGVALSNLVWLLGLVAWIYCLVKAWLGGGARFEIPVIGSTITTYAEKIAAAV